VNAFKSARIFLKDIGDFPAVDEAYGQFFDGEGAEYPARAAVEISNLPGPSEVLIEIESVADLAEK